MSVSTIACGFTSYKHYVGGRPCDNDATHRVLGDASIGEVAIDLCRDHWLYTTGAYPVCGLCGNSKYSDIRVVQREHTCYEGDRGWDCMHFENEDYCDCEGNATEKFESAERTPEVIVDGECVDCEYDNDAETLRDGVPICYECVRDWEASDQEYKDMLDNSGQY